MGDPDRNATSVAPQDGPPLVTVTGIAKSFGGAPAVRSVDLAIRRGEIFAILGPSGCGKSTLLRILAGLEQPDAGEVFIDGQAVTRLPPYERPTNMMFQSYALFPHMTVEENIAYGLRRDRMEKRALGERVDQMLDLVRMRDYRRRRPGQLSGGQQQRVALARSLAQQPKLLLLDEPMGALDRKLRSEMQFELVSIIRRVQVTCVMVTHDQEEAMVMADRLALLQAGEIIQTGSPRDVYDQPNCRFSAEFLGQVNLLPGTVAGIGPDGVRVNVADLAREITAAGAGPLQQGDAVHVALRPERIRLHAPGGPPGIAAGVLQDLAYLGTHTTCHVRLPGGCLVKVIAPGDGAGPPLRSGDTVSLAWQSRDAVVLTR